VRLLKILNLVVVLAVLPQPMPQAPARPEFDVVIYGATSAGVVAAVQARRLGKTAVIVGPDFHLGGLSSGGLGFTDTGNKAVIGGLSRDFYQRVWRYYDRPESWKWQKREEYGNKGQGTPAIDGAQRTMWIFEPHVAERVFEDLVSEYQLRVDRNQWLDRSKGAVKTGGRIVSIAMVSGKVYTGRVFIDATYEGDLMAAAGVDYKVGRESQAEYGEKWNGVQTGVLHHRHHFGVLGKPVSPYVVPGDPTSGTLPRVSSASPGEYGQADKKIQAYCYRYCVTDHPENRIPFPKPDGYDPSQYELLLRIYETGWRETFDKFDPIPNRKTDSNNHGPMSSDNIGLSYDYPEASYERRREILKEHESYQKGWLYFIANDPRVPKDVQERMRSWGLAKDEFTDNGGWPHQIYVREARRMVGAFVMTENELMKRRPTPDSIGMGSYTIDSHNVQRYITPEGYVQNEGDIGVPLPGPYEIAYGALVPKAGQADNLVVPVCVSSTHIAFGSIRMEPVFMVLAHAAATAAAIAIDRGVSVQEVPYSELRDRLLKDGQVLEYTPAAK
jgi:FAD dependent oxidoreductase